MGVWQTRLLQPRTRFTGYDQDEWFYCVEGEWTYVGDTRGRILIVFTPPGKMEAFFREVTKKRFAP
jgi:hypothetical protein